MHSRRIIIAQAIYLRVEVAKYLRDGEFDFQDNWIFFSFALKSYFLFEYYNIRPQFTFFLSQERITVMTLKYWTIEERIWNQNNYLV